jgi:hypothetical protein
MKLFLEILLLIILVFCFGYLFFYYADILFAPGTKQNAESKVCFTLPTGENCFFVELAKTNAERKKGLMNVKQLNENKGMFFIFEREGIYHFWMKNTLIPLDIIWIDSDNKIVFIKESAQPCKSLVCPNINPEAKAKYVLEINGGQAKAIGLKIGDNVSVTY